MCPTERWMYILLAGVVVVVGGLLRAQRNAELEELQTVEVVRGSLTAAVGANGTVRSNQPA
ncbi:MAG: hypothetical protein PVJ07_03330 [Anaerolineales bacterium]